MDSIYPAALGRALVRGGIAATPAFAVALAAFLSLGAVVTLDSPDASGNLLAVPVLLTPGDGDQTASLQFDFQFDSSSVEVADVVTGSCASEAGKDVMFSSFADGSVRVIVAGMNQNTMSGGVVATVYLKPLQEGNTVPVMELGSLVVSDPVGNAIETTYRNLSIEDQSARNSDIADDSDETDESAGGKSAGDGPVTSLGSSIEGAGVVDSGDTIAGPSRVVPGDDVATGAMSEEAPALAEGGRVYDSEVQRMLDEHRGLVNGGSGSVEEGASSARASESKRTGGTPVVKPGGGRGSADLSTSGSTAPAPLAMASPVTSPAVSDAVTDGSPGSVTGKAGSPLDRGWKFLPYVVAISALTATLFPFRRLLLLVLGKD